MNSWEAYKAFNEILVAVLALLYNNISKKAGLRVLFLYFHYGSLNSDLFISSRTRESDRKNPNC